MGEFSNLFLSGGAFVVVGVSGGVISVDSPDRKSGTMM